MIPGYYWYRRALCDQWQVVRIVRPAHYAHDQSDRVVFCGMMGDVSYPDSPGVYVPIDPPTKAG